MIAKFEKRNVSLVPLMILMALLFATTFTSARPFSSREISSKRAILDNLDKNLILYYSFERIITPADNFAVTIPVGEARTALIVPKDALVPQGPMTVVYVLGEDGSATATPVVPGQGAGAWVAVTGELARALPGDTIGRLDLPMRRKRLEGRVEDLCRAIAGELSARLAAEPAEFLRRVLPLPDPALLVPHPLTGRVEA